MFQSQNGTIQQVYMWRQHLISPNSYQTQLFGGFLSSQYLQPHIISSFVQEFHYNHSHDGDGIREEDAKNSPFLSCL